MQDSTIIGRLRAQLQPKGTAPVVLLCPIHSAGIEMHVDFVQKCIDELERIPLRATMGDKITNLEKLAYQLLLDSAYIDPKHEAEREAYLKANMTKWQVFRRVSDGFESWDVDLEGEVFDTEAEADNRANELDLTVPQSWGWHGVRAVDD